MRGHLCILSSNATTLESNMSVREVLLYRVPPWPQPQAL